MKLYFYQAVDSYWSNLGNWFTDIDATIAYGGAVAPWTADDVTKGYDLSWATGGTQPIIDVAIGNGFTITGTCDIGSIANGEQGVSSPTISSGSFSGARFINNGTIAGGSFSGFATEFTNSQYCTINGGTFVTGGDSSVWKNKGSINDGTFTGVGMTNENYINGGTFNMDVLVSSPDYANTISGGTFNAISGVTFILNTTVNGGTFYANPSPGNCTINAGIFLSNSITFNGGGIVYDGTFSGNDINFGGTGSVIYGGTFSGTGFDLTTDGTIEGGIFSGSGFTNTAGTINNGTFTGASFTNATDTYAVINGGTFSGTAGGYIGGTINGGTFSGNGYNISNVVTGGTFSGNNMIISGPVSGGTFSGSGVINQSTGVISGGTFSGNNFINIGTISGGTFTGTMDCSSMPTGWLYITTGDFSGLKGLTFSNSPVFTVEKGINGSGILGMV